MFTPWKESYDQPRQYIKKQRHYFANKSPCSQGYGFSSGHVWMWELDYEESWAPKNWCFWTVVLEKTLWVPWTASRSSPSILKEIPVLGVHWKDWCWSWNSNTLATRCEELTHLKRPWCWERLRAGGEGDDCWGPASAGSRGYPQDEQCWREREKIRETSLDRAKSTRERDRQTDRQSRWGLQQSLAECGNALFFTVVFIPKVSTSLRGR